MASRGPFLFALCAFGGLTNQIHQWAHVPSAPPLSAYASSVTCPPPVAHAAHHAGEYDAHYCITTGWCNRPLESVGFFRRLEEVVTRLTGALPRNEQPRMGRAAPGRGDQAWRRMGSPQQAGHGGRHTRLRPPSLDKAVRLRVHQRPDSRPFAASWACCYSFSAGIPTALVVRLRS